MENSTPKRSNSSATFALPSAAQSTTLGIAARSLLETQAATGTVEGLVAERVLDHALVGLFEYAAIRVGVDAARDVVAALVAEFEEGAFTPADGEMGPRVRLYRRARELVGQLPPRPLAADSTMWWSVPGEHQEAMAELRSALGDADAEVVELYFARRLAAEEVEAVLDVDRSTLDAAISGALQTARRVLGKHAPSHDGTHAGVLLEAYALDRSKVRTPSVRARRRVLEVGTIVAERYEVLELLGVGAFADVYRARDCEVSGHVVALKILRTRSGDARSVRAALRELQLLASVFHPSVVQLKDHGWHDARLWFVMPLYRGETLAIRLRRGPLPREEAREIFEQLAEALATMHRAGVRHQDIKPENVFLASLDHDSRELPSHGVPDALLDAEAPSESAARSRVLPVLLDLGVAAKDAELVLAGTPAYFAPEVAARFAGVPEPPPVGPKADVFSLALTLRQALQPEALADIPGGAVDAFISHRAVHAPAPPDGAALTDLRPHFGRWLAASPDERPTAEAFHRELAVLTLPAERRARLVSTLRWALPIAAAVLAVFITVVGELRRQATASQEEATRAGEDVQRISQSLSESAAARAELEENVARLEREYQESRMTREQLASRLAHAEGALELAAERTRELGARLRDESGSLADAQRDVAQLTRRLRTNEQAAEALSESLARERERAADAVRLAEALAAAERAAAERAEEVERLRMQVDETLETQQDAREAEAGQSAAAPPSQTPAVRPTHPGNATSAADAHDVTESSDATDTHDANDSAGANSDRSGSAHDSNAAASDVVPAQP